MATTLAPLPALAQDATLAPGTVATNATVEAVLIRSTPGYAGEATGEVSPGSQVTIADAPVTADDGSLWYPVGGGFVPASAMSGGDAAVTDTAVTNTAGDPSGVTNQVSGYYDQNGNWVEEMSADTMTEDVAQEAPADQATGYVDENGMWVDTSGEAAAAEQASGYLDESGMWVDTSGAAESSGYVDQNGNWVDTTAAMDETATDTTATDTTAMDTTAMDTTAQEAPAAAATSGYYDQTGAWVDTTGQSTNASGDTMVLNDASGASNTNNATAPPAAPIGTAYIAGTNGDGAICRTAADWSSAELGTVTEGSAVEVTGGTVGEWQPVNCNGVSGYVHASFVSWDAPVTGDTTLTATGEPLVSDTASGYQNNRNNRRGDVNNGGGSGQAIANFAMQYQGYPYVYAGEGPNAFDCSGFTMFVIRNTVGLEITHDMFVQYDMGTKVDRNQLQPGDLVFFENTFRPGMSHNGIYIGNNQMIHAENESTGVKISDITSDYYASRYYGAVRFSTR
ncbi:MAG: NlpC/P60 family protein [Chloroflexota bacterium]|nr:NlpC/P60 family protein [Chloroflexota bacterium]